MTGTYLHQSSLQQPQERMLQAASSPQLLLLHFVPTIDTNLLANLSLVFLSLLRPFFHYPCGGWFCSCFFMFWVQCANGEAEKKVHEKRRCVIYFGCKKIPGKIINLLFKQTFHSCVYFTFHLRE